MTTSKPIGIGMVGAGFARSTQIPGFKNCEGAEIVAIASRHREHAESVAREFGIENVYDTWKELVERDDIDLVSVVTHHRPTRKLRLPHSIMAKQYFVKSRWR